MLIALLAGDERFGAGGAVPPAKVVKVHSGPVVELLWLSFAIIFQK
jgi:hypothetical protein